MPMETVSGHRQTVWSSMLIFCPAGMILFIAKQLRPEIKIELWQYTVPFIHFFKFHFHLNIPELQNQRLKLQA